MKDEIITNLIIQKQDSQVIKLNNEKEKLYEEIEQCEEEIRNNLSPEHENLIINLSDAISVLNEKINMEKCIESFKLGFHLCLEIMQGENNL